MNRIKDLREDRDLTQKDLGNALGKNSEDRELLLKIKGIAKNVFKISSRLAKNVIKDTTNIDIDELEGEIAEKEPERAESIRNLRKEFAEIVDKAKGERGRVVIFVDDLDRLNPEIAVELLEVMKLFMDVPNCVFVLAIDYEVVVNGVRKKFGSDMSEDKCRSFFDKIIQLPFSMPIGSYHIEKMIKEILGDVISDYIEPIGMLVKSSLGANPRTLKRLANSFFLLRIVERNMIVVEDKRDEKLQAALLFISLVVQMYSYEAYMILTDCGDEELVTLFKSYDTKRNKVADDDKDEDPRVIEIIGLVGIALQDVAKIAKMKESAVYEQFRAAITLSSITSVAKISDKGATERKKAMKVTKINIFEEEYFVKNPTYAQIKTYEEIMKKNESRIKEFMEAYPRILTTDAARKDGFFRASKETSLTLDGRKLYIGTSSSSADKIIFTRALCDFMEVEAGTVLWYDGAQIVFKN